MEGKRRELELSRLLNQRVSASLASRGLEVSIGGLRHPVLP